jgi:hypothetical protein
MRNAGLNVARGRSVTPLLLGVCLAWLSLAAFGLLHAGESQPLPSSLGATQTAYLEYRELSNGCMTWNLPLSTQTAAFKKEPALGSRKVVRGTFNLGSSADQSIPFIWDQGKGKLYLDLNRNRDFTDDAGGAFTRSGGFGYNGQTFTNVHLSFKAAGGSHPALVDLNLHDWGKAAAWDETYNQVQGSLTARSYWAGKASLQGREWQLGLVEDTPDAPGTLERSYLVLRPWEDRDRPFGVQDGSLDSFQFCRNLFFNGQAYHLDCAFVRQGGAPRYKADLERRPAELGEIKLTGQFIKRLVLRGSKCTVVMDQPEPVIKVPVGSYGPRQVKLKAGTATAFRETARFAGSQSGNATTVSAKKQTVLAVGGPLTNSVAVNPHGRSLNLSYQLFGAGGETYQLLGARPQPEFAAYRGGKQIASGKFEFG